MSNVTQIANHPQHGTQQFIWDEADRLMAVKNNQGLHHYVYDHTGTRLLKGTYTEGVINVDGVTIGNNIYTPAPYTVYTGPHMVCTFYADAVDVTKHYYAGAQRVASKLYQTPYGMDCPPEAPADPENPEPGGFKTEPQPTSNYIWCQQPVQRESDIVVQGFKEYILKEFDGATVPQNPQLPAATPSALGSFAYQPCEELDWQNFDPEVQYEGGNLIYLDCLCRNNPELALEKGINCQTFTEIYWYHPDYLGNTEFITDAGGYPYQFFYYSAFGESLVQQNANTGSFATPYKFNAKEQDPETGNYYYGARYYNPQTSIWFGVDPLAHMYPHLTPYNFVEGNPIMMIDPDGRKGYKVGEDGIFIEVDDTGGKEFDVLYNADQSSMAATTFEPGTFEAKNREWDMGKDEDGVFFIGIINTKNMDKADADILFEFLTESTNVEWSDISMDDESGNCKRWISTTYRTNNEKAGQKIINREMRSGSILDRHVHSHPEDYVFFPSPADINGAFNVEQFFPDAIMEIYLPKTREYHRYNSQSPNFMLDEIIVKPE